jgi:5-methylcytosine-specific restriction endonuclease McrA
VTSVAEALAVIEAAQLKRAARAERLREQKAKSFYNSFAWRKVRYQFLRTQPRPLRCAVCGRSTADGVTLCVDHVKSVKRYPELRLNSSDLQVLCNECNLGKGSQFADDWRAGEGEQIERHSADAQSPHGGF